MQWKVQRTPTPWVHSSMSARGSASPQEPPVTLSLPRLGRLGALLAGEDKGAGDRAAQGHTGPTRWGLPPGAAPGLLRPAEGPSGTRHSLGEAQLTPERHGFGLRASAYIGTFFNNYYGIHPRASHPRGTTDTEGGL